MTWVSRVFLATCLSIAAILGLGVYTLVSTGGHNLRRPVICVSQTKQRKTV